MAIERYGSKTDVVVKLVLVFFVCLLSFSVGTFVGKKFSDNQHRLAQFEPASAEREVASVTGDGKEGATKSGEALSDEEIAKLAEEFVNEDEGAAHAATAKTEAHGAPAQAAHGAPAKDAAKDAVAAAPAKAAVDAHGAPTRTIAEAKTSAEAKPADAHGAPASAPAKPAAVAAPAAKPSAEAAHAAKPSAVAEKIAAGHAAPAAHAPAAKTPASEAKVTLKPDTEKKPVPTSLPQDVAASAVGKYTVQVASYPTETEATKMTENLKGQGFGAFFIKADIVDKKTAATKTWYRVSVGLFQTQKEADAYKADLLSRSKVSSAIVQKVSK